ncbi:MAG: hypothetical protein ACLR6J_14325 [Parabacteroides merdae]
MIICHEHTNVVYVEKNGVVLTDRRKEGVSCDASGDEDELRLSFSTVCRICDGNAARWESALSWKLPI